jgi:putative selenate reductase
MYTADLSRILLWMMNEYKQCGSMFGIPSEQFYRENPGSRVDVFGRYCVNALGPAAGPHTQLSQNIVASYLCGARFFELKTVQILDRLEIEKPCISAVDECYNTEWSQELTLQRSYEQYLDAWFAIHLLEALFGTAVAEGESFVFNMSVGYDLKGIRQTPMDNFIESMRDAAGNDHYARAREQLADFITRLDLSAGDFPGLSAIKGLADRISPKITDTVTLSTMHGCPPGEIEEICDYLLVEKELDTYVKLNPTLLGYQTVRSMLDRLGYQYLQLDPDAFARDLQMSDAVGMLERLQQRAKLNGRVFGIKLTNTLGVVNGGERLPGNEMYMSGRSLFPLAVNLAARLAEEFNGRLPISFSAGVSQNNATDLMACGIRPLTLATDLLKPGGFARLKAIAVELEKTPPPHSDRIEVDALRSLAAESLQSKRYHKSWRAPDVVSVDSDLPLFDCYLAPCVVACPVGQDVPEYLRLVGQGRYREALALIYAKNALPHITGHICDHQCQFNCTRVDYEGTVKIRKMKLIAAEQGWDEFIRSAKFPPVRYGTEVAVIGAGAAGFSAAFSWHGQDFRSLYSKRRIRLAVLSAM